MFDSNASKIMERQGRALGYTTLAKPSGVVRPRLGLNYSPLKLTDGAQKQIGSMIPFP